MCSEDWSDNCRNSGGRLFQRGVTAMAKERFPNFTDELTEGRRSVRANQIDLSLEMYTRLRHSIKYFDKHALQACSTFGIAYLVSHVCKQRTVLGFMNRDEFSLLLTWHDNEVPTPHIIMQDHIWRRPTWSVRAFTLQGGTRPPPSL